MKKPQLIQCLALILIATGARAADPEPRYQMPPTEVTATRAPREGFDLPLATAVVADVGRARPGLSLPSRCVRCLGCSSPIATIFPKAIGLACAA